MDERICKKDTSNLICPNVFAAAFALCAECRFLKQNTSAMTMTQIKSKEIPSNDEIPAEKEAPPSQKLHA